MGQNSKRGGRGRGNHRGSGRGGRGRGGGNYHSGGGGNGYSSFVDELDFGYGLGFGNSMKNGSGTFLLQDEARNTERHRRYGGSNSGPLRHNAISFVSAGTMDPVVLMKPTQQLNPWEVEKNPALPAVNPPYLDQVGAVSETTKASAASDINAVSATLTVRQDTTFDAIQSPETEVGAIEEPSEQVPFVVDIVTTKTYSEAAVVANLADLSVSAPTESRPASRASSCSEEILFVPRNKRSKQDPSISEAEPGASSESHERELAVATHNDSPSVIIADEPMSSNLATTMISLSKSNAKKKRRTEIKELRARRAERSLQWEEENAILDDYIANMDKEDLHNITANYRDLGLENVWEDVTEEDDSARSPYEDDSEMSDFYHDDILQGFQAQDFDGMDTADDAEGVADVILAKRVRPSGLQYLVKWVGADVDEAVWIHADSLNSSAAELIRAFERRQSNIKSIVEDKSSDDETDDDDDAYLQQKRAQEDADFKLARRLAGYPDSDEIDDCLKGEEEEDTEVDLARFMDMKIDHRIGKFPNATRLAKLYDNFDPMDWATPARVAPKKANKAKKKQDLNLSDEEAEAHLLNMWEHDRQKKKARKAERAALRAERKKTPKQKYKEGLGIEELEKQITDFLLHPGKDYLALPPTNKSTRKSIHNLASVFSLKSKSQGSGKQRFTVLYKTHRSSLFEGDRQMIQSAFNSSVRKLFRNGSDKTNGKGAGGGRKTGGRGEHTHRDGDIVGAVAPEIPMDNKGRLMLEKMGYKTGMALGAAGNKGIMTPIVAIVKTSKAGLG